MGLNLKSEATRRGAATKVLLEHKAQVNLADEDGVTPLHLAAYHGRAGMVDLLLAAKAKVELADKRGRTALHWAALGNQSEIIEKLLAQKANLEATDDAGDTASASGRPAGSVWPRSRPCSPTRLTSTPATMSALRRWYCWHRGCTVTARLTPLLAQTAKLLLAAGADVQARDNSGQTALDYARQREYPQLTEVLETSSK